mgnify:CR=1 FL=1
MTDCLLLLVRSRSRVMHGNVSRREQSGEPWSPHLPVTSVSILPLRAESYPRHLARWSCSKEQHAALRSNTLLQEATRQCVSFLLGALRLEQGRCGARYSDRSRLALGHGVGVRCLPAHRHEGGLRAEVKHAAAAAEHAGRREGGRTQADARTAGQQAPVPVRVRG